MKVSNLKVAIFCKNPEMCIKIKKCICSVSVHCGITVRITVFDDWDKIIEMFSKRPNFFDLAVLCCGEDYEMTAYAKKLRDCDKNFDLMVIGENKKQLYSLFELRICSFVFEKDVDEYLKQDKILVTKEKKGKQTVIDIKDIIKNIEIIDDNTFKIFVRFLPTKNLKLEKILQNLLKIQEKEVKMLYTKRDKLFVENKGITYEI